MTTHRRPFKPPLRVQPTTLWDYPSQHYGQGVQGDPNYKGATPSYIIWNLLRRAPDRIVAAVLAQPSGSRPEMRDLFYDTNMKGWGPELVKRRPEISMEMVDRFLTRMYRTNPDFVFTVTRDFVRTCQTPVLILPDDVPAHPYAVAMEAAMLAPKAEVSLYPWKEPKERIPLAVRHIRSFLRSHRPA